MESAGVRAEVLDNAGLRSLEPNLAPDLAGGALFPDDAQVDPRHATLAMLAAARRQGPPGDGDSLGENVGMDALTRDIDP